MKFLYAVIGVVFLVLSVVLLIKPWQSKQQDSLATTNQNEKAMEPAWQQQALNPNEKVIDRRTMPTTKQTKSTVVISRECQQFWQDFRSTDLTKHDLYEKGGEAFPDASRCKNLPPAFEFAQKVFIDKCKRDFEPKYKALREYDCQVAAFNYRTMMTEYFTKDTPIRNIDDPRILNDKLYARFSADPAAALEIAERLRELEPDNYTALQTSIYSRMAQVMDGRYKTDERFWAELKADLKRAQSTGTKNQKDDPQWKEVDLMIAYRENLNLDTLHEKAEALNRNDPGSGLGPYYLAMEAYKRNDPDAGMKALVEAVRRESNNARYKGALEFAKKVPDFYKDPQKKGTAFNYRFQMPLQISPDVN